MFDYQAFLQSVPSDPGVYCMRDKHGKLLYVGKAKNLKNRLQSYFREQSDPRIDRMVKQIARIDLNIATSEQEALLLENNLIKALKPRYNIMFRDDKSYPYLFLSKHQFPQFIYLRGQNATPGELFGPYPSVVAVREALNLLQKTFKLRQCDDYFFQNRSRPCLQYQIKRCTAPCVGIISDADYQKDVQSLKLFLKGNQVKLIDELIAKMEAASNKHEYEQAAQLRNQISALQSLSMSQAAVVAGHCSKIDVLAIIHLHQMIVIGFVCVRNSHILDSHTFFSEHAGEALQDLSQALYRFIAQFYLDETHPKDLPKEIVTNIELEEADLLSATLSQSLGEQIKIKTSSRGIKARWIEMASKNAKVAIEQRSMSANVYSKRWVALKQALGISNGLKQIECFDISHHQGEATMASCVVFNDEGPDKKAYRSYGLEVTTGDDYAAMQEVLTRRYSKLKTEGKPIPGVILIDGGKGQLSTALKALNECQLLDVIVVGIAKGAGRKPGLETLFITDLSQSELKECHLQPSDPALHLLQHIRDEAHRFAIRSHRKRLTKGRKTSVLEGIPGVGQKRRQDLLRYFGGLQGLTSANIDAIAKVPGISQSLAKTIYEFLHEKS